MTIKASVRTRLTEQQVKDIRWLLDSKKECPKRLARQFGLTAETVRRIGRRFSFKWVGEG